MTPADLFDLADRPAPPVLPGQLTVDDPRPVVQAGPPEPLFDLDLLLPHAPIPCTWHPTGDFPAATHRIVLAVNLMDPRWWAGGARLGCLCHADHRHPIRLYTVGAGVCDDCIARGARTATGGVVQHVVPISA